MREKIYRKDTKAGAGSNGPRCLVTTMRTPEVIFAWNVNQMEGASLRLAPDTLQSTHSQVRRSSQAAPVCVGIVWACSSSELDRRPLLAHRMERLNTQQKDHPSERQRMRKSTFNPIKLRTRMALQKADPSSHQGPRSALLENSFAEQRRPQDAPPQRRHTECAVTAPQVQVRHIHVAPAFKNFL